MKYFLISYSISKLLFFKRDGKDKYEDRFKLNSSIYQFLTFFTINLKLFNLNHYNYFFFFNLESISGNLHCY